MQQQAEARPAPADAGVACLAMRVAVASILQETNTFSSARTGFGDFSVATGGEAMEQSHGTNSEMAGACAALMDDGATVVPVGEGLGHAVRTSHNRGIRPPIQPVALRRGDVSPKFALNRRSRVHRPIRSYVTDTPRSRASVRQAVSSRSRSLDRVRPCPAGQSLRR
jgi:hypothetical protein